MTREELVDELRDALSDACDMDVTFGMYAEAAVRRLEKHGVFREWQPIETVPKDGRSVLIYNDRGVSEVVWLLEWQAAVPLDGWYIDAMKAGWFPLRGELPTHWMPMPEPPEAADA